MRSQGKITRWDDDRGFGFVTTNGTNTSIFVHIKAFSPRWRRPEVGDVISFDISEDKTGKQRAVKARWTDKATRHKPSGHSRGKSKLAVIFTMSFLVALPIAAYLGRIPWLVVAVYAIASFITFIVYGWDKSSARNGRWRTQENTLHFFSFLCGWPGALIAQRAFRHKSSKKEFLSVFWFTVFLNVAALGYLIWEGKEGAINQLIEDLWNRFLLWSPKLVLFFNQLLESITS